MLSQNHLFHPFSQENPLQTGTGLGLAIVNSIVRSSSVDGKVDVWSAEGVGTEIKITFTAEKLEDSAALDRDTELVKIYDGLHRPSISLVGFDSPHKGVQLLRTVLSSYLVARWGMTIAEDPDEGEIVIVNEDPSPVVHAAEAKGRRRPFIVLSPLRGDPKVMSIVNEYERAGGFCRVAFKPVGPHRLYSVLKLCLHALHIAQAKFPHDSSSQSLSHLYESPSDPGGSYTNLSRRYSEERTQSRTRPHLRPPLGPRAATAQPSTSWTDLTETAQPEEFSDSASTSGVQSPVSQSPSSPTIAIGTGGSLLKTSVGTLQAKGPARILVVEDNAILRNLL